MVNVLVKRINMQNLDLSGTLGSKVYDILRGKGIVVDIVGIGQKSLLKIEFITMDSKGDVHDLYTIGGYKYNHYRNTYANRTLFKLDDMKKVKECLNMLNSELPDILDFNQSNHAKFENGKLKLYSYSSVAVKHLLTSEYKLNINSDVYNVLSGRDFIYNKNALDITITVDKTILHYKEISNKPIKTIALVKIDGELDENLVELNNLLIKE
jgi:hypothetical protein